MRYSRLIEVSSSVADLDDFWLDPDLTFEIVQIRILIKIDFRPNFLWKLFWRKYALKKYIYEPQGCTKEIPKVFVFLKHTKNVYVGSFIKACIQIRI
jgi:hypothetical protein